MYCEYPVREEHVHHFKNRYVGVVLMDGTRHYGVVTGCENGRLILNGQAEASAGKRKRKKAGVRAKSGNKTATKALLPPPPPPFVPPFGPFVPPVGPRLVLDLATIALLFALLP
ncbi:hypothetical protein [Paenibacillus sp.]|uniref:hypothetical protein n=1 Tax=Paenibacillus sp. TaxID=58172 RepID=UPI002D2AFC4A|nr:hypothetical protein [Paenibacillus sp.]HZG84537.1 hypothetical protein [Paenibacillus sp.]